MLRHLYTDERTRARALGVWTAVSGLALALGPVVGGALVGVWNWRAIFWFNLVFGAGGAGRRAGRAAGERRPGRAPGRHPGLRCSARRALSALIFAVINAETAGFADPSVIALLCVSAVAGAAFFWWESRAAHPLLDLRYLRVPRFLTANVVAFCAYFATFAIFFFTALYLAEVVGYSGYEIALVFLPMTVLMIGRVPAGRAGGPHRPRRAGPSPRAARIFGAGLLLTALVISPSPNYAELAATLALTGIGIGATVVPVTTAALSAVPPERSGMAASATNTSREIGAVIGVAVLGMLVNSQLNASLVGRLRALGIPANFQSIVINAIETGTVPSQRQRAGPARQQTRAGSHPRRLQRVLLGPARRAVPLGGADVRGGPVHPSWSSARHASPPGPPSQPSRPGRPNRRVGHAGRVGLTALARGRAGAASWDVGRPAADHGPWWPGRARGHDRGWCKLRHAGNTVVHMSNPIRTPRPTWPWPPSSSASSGTWPGCVTATTWSTRSPWN